MKRNLQIVALMIFLSGFLPHVYPDVAQLSQMKDTSACIRHDELILFRMVNDVRIMANLPPLKLSPSLCLVARSHINDLMIWSPMKNECGLQSWSNKGLWTPCCYNKDPKSGRCMTDKPRELTNYQGDGFELIFWDESGITPASAAKTWKEYKPSLDMILGSGAWQSKKWQVMGIAANTEYAVIWFGEQEDKVKTIKACDSDTLIYVRDLPVKAMEKKAFPVPAKNNESSKPAEKASTPPVKQKAETQDMKGNASSGITPASIEQSQQWFLIVAFVKNEQAAISEVKRLKNKGYRNAGYLVAESGFRIYAGKYSSETEAQAAKERSKASFPGLWIFKP